MAFFLPAKPSILGKPQKIAKKPLNTELLKKQDTLTKNYYDNNGDIT